MYVSLFSGKFRCNEPTNHYLYERDRRKNALINSIPKGRLLQSFYVDRGHKNGAEIHYMFSNGVVVIVNAKTKRLITKLIARPTQAYRYYEACGLHIPMELLGTCYYNTKILRLNRS